MCVCVWRAVSNHSVELYFSFSWVGGKLCAFIWLLFQQHVRRLRNKELFLSLNADVEKPPLQDMTFCLKALPRYTARKNTSYKQSAATIVFPISQIFPLIQCKKCSRDVIHTSVKGARKLFLEMPRIRQLFFRFLELFFVTICFGVSAPSFITFPHFRTPCLYSFRPVSI